MILPCELIDKNAEKLKEAIYKYITLWELGNPFKKWIDKANVFCNTLVDRIVPGYPKNNIDEIWKQLGYIDKLVVESETFNLWVIEGDKNISNIFPVDKYGGNAIIVDDVTPYKKRKVRILNGAHTSIVPIGLLYGIETIREVVEDDIVGEYLKRVMFDEIINTLDLPKSELLNFANQVIERFKNPYINHYLISISLNSMSKYKTRVLPTILEFYKINGNLPKYLCFSLAAYINLYNGNIKLKDSEDVISLYKESWDNYDGTKKGMDLIVEKILGYKSNWDINLNSIKGLNKMISNQTFLIYKNGMNKTLNNLLYEEK